MYVCFSLRNLIPIFLSEIQILNISIEKGNQALIFLVRPVETNLILSPISQARIFFFIETHNLKLNPWRGKINICKIIIISPRQENNLIHPPVIVWQIQISNITDT